MTPTIKRVAHQPGLFSAFEVEGYGQVIVLCDMRMPLGMCVRTIFIEDDGDPGELRVDVPFTGEWDDDRAEQVAAFAQLNDIERLAQVLLPALAGRFKTSDEAVATMNRETGAIEVRGGRFDA